MASDIPAFEALLGEGKYGSLFASENPRALSKAIVDLLKDGAKRDRLKLDGKEYAQGFDWDAVAERIYDVYEMAMVGLGKVVLSSENRGWNKFLGK